MGLLKKIIEKNARKIVLTGGEPTERDDILELVCWLMENDVHVNIQTNGTNTAIINDLVSACANNLGDLSFMIPLHAASCELHDSISGRRGSFNAVMKTLELLSENGIYVVGKIIFTRFTDNLDRITDLFFDKGVKDVIIAYPHCASFPDDLVKKIALELVEIQGSLDFIHEKNEMNILLQGFPYCSTPGMLNHIQERDEAYLKTDIIEIKYKDDFEYRWHEYRKKDKRKFTKCQYCPYNGDCEGVWKEYIRVFGDLALI